MPPTTSPEVTTPLVRRLSISALIELENLLISALVSKVSLFSRPSVVELDLVLDPFSSRDSPSTTVRNPSSVSQSTHHHRCQLLLLSHTTLCCPLTPFLIMRLSTISPEETLISRDQPTPT